MFDLKKYLRFKHEQRNPWLYFTTEQLFYNKNCSQKQDPFQIGRDFIQPTNIYSVLPMLAISYKDLTFENIKTILAFRFNYQQKNSFFNRQILEVLKIKNPFFHKMLSNEFQQYNFKKFIQTISYSFASIYSSMFLFRFFLQFKLKKMANFLKITASKRSLYSFIVFFVVTKYEIVERRRYRKLQFYELLCQHRAYILKCRQEHQQFLNGSSPIIDYQNSQDLPLIQALKNIDQSQEYKKQQKDQVQVVLQENLLQNFTDQYDLQQEEFQNLLEQFQMLMKQNNKDNIAKTPLSNWKEQLYKIISLEKAFLSIFPNGQDILYKPFTKELNKRRFYLTGKKQLTEAYKLLFSKNANISELAVTQSQCSTHQSIFIEFMKDNQKHIIVIYLAKIKSYKKIPFYIKYEQNVPLFSSFLLRNKQPLQNYYFNQMSKNYLIQHLTSKNLYSIWTPSYYNKTLEQLNNKPQADKNCCDYYQGFSNNINPLKDIIKFESQQDIEHNVNQQQPLTDFVQMSSDQIQNLLQTQLNIEKQLNMQQTQMQTQKNQKTAQQDNIPRINPYIHNYKKIDLKNLNDKDYRLYLDNFYWLGTPIQQSI